MATMAARNRIYWACQIGGWSAFALAGVWFASRSVGWSPALVAGYALYPVYSIALTDGLRRTIERRGWLTDRAGRHRVLLVLAVLVVGVVQTALIVAINVVLEHGHSALLHPSAIFYIGLGTTGATATWLVYYARLTEERRSREREAHLQAALNEARLLALESQLNPHFLFNCLNSIRGLVSADPARSQDLITRLANLLRYTVDRRQSLVALDAELDVVADYLALESARLEDRLRVEMDVAPGARAIRVPTMLLLTLVENAVKHGIAPLRGGGTLTIRVTVDAGGATLEVENSGSLTETPARTGGGLANARDRLRILFGSAASLDLGAHDTRVLARARIPLVP